MGCPHYITGAELQCKTCGKFFGCRRCHDEEVFDHQFPKEQTDTMRCRFCGTVQPLAQVCTHCGETLGHQYCSICKFLADFNSDGKPFYHCDKCNACNIGFKEFTIHCDKCDSCISTHNYKTHKCVKPTTCCVCLGDLKQTKYYRDILRCGHQIHDYCKVKLMDSGSVTCPICKRLILDGEALRIANAKMQKAFDDVIIMVQDIFNFWKIQCNECQHTFVSLRNIKQLYQCPKCKQFNCE